MVWNSMTTDKLPLQIAEDIGGPLTSLYSYRGVNKLGRNFFLLERQKERERESQRRDSCKSFTGPSCKPFALDPLERKFNLGPPTRSSVNILRKQKASPMGVEGSRVPSGSCSSVFSHRFTTSARCHRPSA
jgi:hypothetical protein